MAQEIFRTRPPDFIFKLLFTISNGILLSVIIFSIIDSGSETVAMLVCAACFGIIVMRISAMNTIKIIIDGHFLIIKNVFTLYRADISQITTVRKGETMWSGFHKYGTVTKGLTVFAKGKEDLYITPQDEEKFISLLHEINANIKFELV